MKTEDLDKRIARLENLHIAGFVAIALIGIYAYTIYKKAKK